MQLRFSVLARNRTFSKAMRLVRLKIQPLLDAFEATELAHPIHEAILVGITDDKDAQYFEEIENNDGFFQVIAGCRQNGTIEEFARDVFEILQRAVRLCPFATPDRETFEDLFATFRPVVLAS